MKKLVIIGAGGLGREVFHWAQKNPYNNNVWTLKGFLDDNPVALQGYDYPVPIINSIEGHIPASDELFVCAIGNPAFRERCASLIQQKGGEFINLIHPKATLGGNIILGRGVIINPGAILSADLRIGNHVVIDSNANVGHDAVIGDYSHLSLAATVGGGAHIGKACFLGVNSTVLPRIELGDGATLGAGSVLTKDMPEGRILKGIPAR